MAIDELGVIGHYPLPVFVVACKKKKTTPLRCRSGVLRNA